MLAYFSASGVNLLLLAIAWFTFALKVFAVVDAALRRPEAFVAAGKLNKNAWLGMTGAAFVVALLPISVIHPLNIVGDIVAIIYLVDVRPAIRALGGRAGSIMFFGRGSRGPRGGGSSDW